VSIFGPGVGGGLLAAAGAAGGLGQGITAAGQQQQKVDLETKMSELAQSREEAITRLQGTQQSGLEEQRAAHQEKDVQQEIAGRSNVAQFEAGQKASEAAKGREFSAEQNTQHQTSQEKIAAGHDVARVGAAAEHANANKAPPKDWSFRNVTTQGSIDPVTHQPTPGRSYVVLQHRDGRQFVQTGDKFLPYDASADKVQDSASVRRAPAGAIQDLSQDPNGTTPSGNPKSEVFLQRYGYLPMPWFSAASQAKDQANAAAQNHGFGAAAVPKGASVSPAQPMGGPTITQNEQEEPPDPAESEANPTAPGP
jgi:hypothetical protein